jgi:hypothetical protein
MFPSSRKIVVLSTAFAALLWFAGPADAQHGRSGSSQGARSAPQSSQSHGQAQARSAPAPQHSAPQRSAPAPQRAAPQQRSAPQQQPRAAAPQTRSFSQQHQAPQNSRSIPGARVQPRGNESHGNVSRGQASPRPEFRNSFNGRPSSSFGRSFPNYGYNRFHEIRRPVFVRPYYSFRPRFSLGFGIFSGFPVAYPYDYYDPYGFYNYGISIAPSYSYGSGYSSSYDRVGGLSFDIDPVDAAIYIDGNYVGTSEDFSSAQMPLTVMAGRHHIDLRADGFQTISFDITVVAKQVIPYQGALPIK